jgi:hypothetical protein
VCFHFFILSINIETLISDLYIAEYHFYHSSFERFIHIPLAFAAFVVVITSWPIKLTVWYLMKAPAQYSSGFAFYQELIHRRFIPKM